MLRYFLRLLLNMLARMPLSLLYLVSDLLFYIVYYLIGYRRYVVEQNLRNSFPEKTDAERKRIERAFYRHFCDLGVESLKAAAIRKNDINKRMKFLNMDLIKELYQQGKSIVLVSGHYGNWEWMLGTPLYNDYQNISLYHPLSSEFFDDYVKNLRQRFGTKLIPMGKAIRKMMEYDAAGVRTFTFFLADQGPLSDARFWATFLKQESAFFEGPAKIARKLKQAFVFLDIQKVKRGYYQAEFHIIAEDASQKTEEWLIFSYIRRLEKQIQDKPQYWLWSHRRWKRKRPLDVPLREDVAIF